MPDLAMLDYFYGDEAEQFTFYRIPKVLFTDPSYRRISSDAKILYGLMLDRMGLSVRNGWLDEYNPGIHFLYPGGCFGISVLRAYQSRFPFWGTG